MRELEERIVEGVVQTGWLLIFKGEEVGIPMLGD
jgi:hypothetical protein